MSNFFFQNFAGMVFVEENIKENIKAIFLEKYLFSSLME